MSAPTNIVQAAVRGRGGRGGAAAATVTAQAGGVLAQAAVTAPDGGDQTAPPTTLAADISVAPDLIPATSGFSQDPSIAAGPAGRHDSREDEAGSGSDAGDHEVLRRRPSIVASTSDDEGADPAALHAAAQAAAAHGEALVNAGQTKLDEAARQDARRIADETTALAASGAAAVAGADKDAGVKAAQQAAVAAKVLEDAAAATRERQLADQKAAAAAARKLKEAETKANEAAAAAAGHAERGAVLSTEGRTDVARGLDRIETAANLEAEAARKFEQEASKARATAAVLAQQAANVSAETGITPADAPPTASTPASPSSPIALPASDVPVVAAEKKEEGAASSAETTNPKTTDDCKKQTATHANVKKGVNKKVIGSVIGLAALSVAAGALLLAPQYVLYVGSVALSYIAIQATALAAKITGSLLIAATTATLLTGVVAAVNAIMNHLQAKTAAAKGGCGNNVTAIAQTTDADGHTVTAKATVAANDAHAASTSTKKFLGFLPNNPFNTIFGSKETATAVAAAAPAPATLIEEEEAKRSRSASVTG